MTQTAAEEFQDAVGRLAGPVEKHLASDLMNRVRVIADDPSLRSRIADHSESRALTISRFSAPPTNWVCSYSPLTRSSFVVQPHRK